MKAQPIPPSDRAESPATLVVRVLSGRLRGATRLLPPGGRISIGHEFWHDVVLRQPDTRGIALELALCDNGVARITMLQGQASLLGAVVEAGQAVTLPPFVPLFLGGAALAFGPVQSARWAEAEALAAGEEAPAEPSATIAPVGPAARILTELRRHAPSPRWLLAGALLLVGVAAAEPLMDATGLRPGPAERAADAIEQAGITGVTLTRADDGRMVAGGLVPTEATRARLGAVLADAGVDAIVDVQTREELARAAVDVARMNGIAAAARVLPDGTLELRTPPLEAGAQQSLQAAVRRDVPLAARLLLRGDLPAVDAPVVRTVSDAAKRVATVVAGDPSYIRTADGARYFEGATMPSGHRLVAIEANTVVLEMNGRRTRLSF